MKKLLAITLALMIFSTSAFAEEIKVTVNGMVCAFCSTGIEKTFKKQQEVESVTVDLDKKLVTVHTNNKENLTDDKIKKLITDAGYTVTDIKRAK